MIHKALEFAAKKHFGQVRKGGDVPYIAHPAEVMYYLAISNADQETIVAGILHDTIEDTNTTYQELKKEFGEKVAYLVRLETEDKTMPWQLRKDQAVSNLVTAPVEAKLICCADKISNLKSILADKTEGKDVWSKFTGTKQQTMQIYQKIIDALSSLNSFFIYHILVQLFKQVFFE